MISGFIFSIKCLILFVWTIQTYSLRRHPVAMDRNIERSAINVSYD